MVLTMKTVVLFIVIVLHGCFADGINRKSFPDGFTFGTASASYQYEGAVKKDGRGVSIWDTFAHIPGKIADSSTGDVAVDQYHLYKDDIKLMKDMGMDAYRFSIAWPRIFPNGSGQINQAGVDHYNALINSLLANNIEPYVTLYHWDLPQALEDKYHGWLDTRIINDFANYAETCFEKFGDRVKNWATFNEPRAFTLQGFAIGIHAPGRCSESFGSLCLGGNSFTEPYIVAHNVLLSHAAAFDIYKRKYKATQNGHIGIAFDVIWYVPGTDKPEDIEATQRAQDFQLGWFLDPIMFGDYPTSMRTNVGNLLPRFSKVQSDLLKGSLDYVGINHYTTWYAWDSSDNSTRNIYELLDIPISPDAGAFIYPIRDGEAIGDRANSEWLYIVPEGFRSLLNYVKSRYGNPPVLIMENGMDDPNDPSISLDDALKDEKRVKYFNDYLTNLLAAIKKDGCNVEGYFAWSLLDNFEWAEGYTSRFGLHFIDYNDKLKRYAKDSAVWFKNFLTAS
ncbi:beta-glucosidase 40-like [Bidens hawaiensis]|uniref:beta-glucosidase 40-like n=1 Tax=Bidens hawaiensis TaxID=980011 RepID=UPI004049BD2C